MDDATSWSDSHDGTKDARTSALCQNGPGTKHAIAYPTSTIITNLCDKQPVRGSGEQGPSVMISPEQRVTHSISAMLAAASITISILFSCACSRTKVHPTTDSAQTPQGAAPSEASAQAAIAAGLGEYERQCNAGNGERCNGLGAMYANGQGVPVDAAKAVALYQRACDAGFAFGCTNLGSSYKKGRGVVVDPAKAATGYQRGCDGGSSFGCAQLALMYTDGDGVSANPAKAAALYERACNGSAAFDSGAAFGCLNLGVMYINGEGGLSPDKMKAVTLFQRACDGNNPSGCLNLAIAYDTGDGVVADRSKARTFYQRACDGGQASACKAIGKPLPP